MKTKPVLLLIAVSGLACAGSRPVPTAVAADHKGARAARADGMAAYNAKDFPRCAELFGSAARLAPGRAEDGYSEACCLALGGQPDRAFAALDRSVKLGWRDAGGMESDTDLTSLHADPRWAQTLAAVKASVEARMKGANPELRRIHDEDQADRRAGPSGINWAEVNPRDIARRKRVKEIVGAGELRVAVDYYHAAMVFQHGDTPEDFQQAHALAVRASELDPTDQQSRWLAAAAKDRELMNASKPQLYGTQFKKIDGVWQLWQTDPSITDEERERWNVPPLAEAQQRAKMLNASR